MIATNDKPALLGRLRQSQECFLASLHGVSEQQSRIRPAENSWSILEVAEHVAIAQTNMYKMLVKGSPTKGEPNLAKDAVICKAVLERAQKRDAPDATVPSGRFTSLAAAVENFQATRERIVQYLEHHNGDLRQVSANHPLLGIVDGWQLVLVMA